MKKLIVNADDFGNTSGVNRGIIYGFKNGIITSTSLMVKRGQAEEAAKLAKENPGLGIGLHFELFMEENNNVIRKTKKTLSVLRPESAKKQFYEQIEIFQKLMDKMPDHIDGHYHVHKLPMILPFIKEFSSKNKIPLRAVGKVNFIDSFSTPNPKDASVINLIKILRNLSDGVSELMTHPGYSSKKLRETSSMSDSRENELKILTHLKIKQVIKEEVIYLISWKDVKMI